MLSTKKTKRTKFEQLHQNAFLFQLQDRQNRPKSVILGKMISISRNFVLLHTTIFFQSRVSTKRSICRAKKKKTAHVSIAYKLEQNDLQ